MTWKTDVSARLDEVGCHGTFDGSERFGEVEKPAETRNAAFLSLYKTCTVYSKFGSGKK